MGWVTVAIVVSALAAVASATCVGYCWSVFQTVKSQPSLSSLRAELLETRDYMAKIDRWAKRINARDVMQDRRAAAGGNQELPLDAPATSKDALRVRAGLVAGRPAPHRN